MHQRTISSMFPILTYDRISRKSTYNLLNEGYYSENIKNYCTSTKETKGQHSRKIGQGYGQGIWKRDNLSQQLTMEERKGRRRRKRRMRRKKRIRSRGRRKRRKRKRIR